MELPFRRMEGEPGQELQVDFGQGAWGVENGKRRRPHLFRGVLSHSRKGDSEFLELILQDELNVRHQRQLERRTKAADFRTLKSLEDFDWQFNPSISRNQIFELAAGNYLREGKDILFLGPPGMGKTHLAQALGYEAIKQGKEVLYRSIFDLERDFLKDEAFKQQDKALRRYLKPDLVIIDDMGLKQLPKQSGEYAGPWKAGANS